MNVYRVATRVVIGVVVLLASACSEKVARGPGAPYFASEPVTSARVGVPYDAQMVAVDPQGSSVTYSVVTGPTGLAIDASTGAITWTPTGAQAGPQNVHLRAKAKGDEGEIAFQILVGYNQPPVIYGASQGTLCVGKAIASGVTTVDPDGDPVTVSLISGPPGLEIDADSGAFEFTPGATHVGLHTVVVSAADPFGGEAQEEVEVRVSGFAADISENTLVAFDDVYTIDDFHAIPGLDDTIWVAWIDEHLTIDGLERVLVTQVDELGCAAAPQVVGPLVSGRRVDEIQVAPSPDGGAYVLWSEEGIENNSEFEAGHIVRIDAEGGLSWPEAVRAVIPNTDNYYEYEHALLADANGVVVVFNDGDYTVGQRLDPDGNRLWGADGVQIGGGGYEMVWQGVLPDGSGGVYLAWNSYYGARAQHLLVDGTLAWTPDDEYGVDLAPGYTGDNCGGYPVYETGRPQVALDADGNLFASWNRYEYCTGQYKMQASKVTADGVVVWYRNDFAGTNSYGQGSYAGRSAVVVSGGDLAIVLNDYWNGGLRAWRLDAADGSSVWGTVFPANGDYGDEPSVDAPDGDLVVTWYSDSNVFGQRIAALDGSLVWNDGDFPALVTTKFGEQYSPVTLRTSDGGTVSLFWHNQYDPVTDQDLYGIYLQRLGPDGLASN